MNTPAIAITRTGERIKGFLTTEHAASSYGQPVFVDADNQAIDWTNIASIDTPKPAAILGSARSERKAATSRENGKRGGRPKATAEQKARARISRMTFSQSDLDFIWADWPNWDEHISWLLTARKSEIMDWIEAGK